MSHDALASLSRRERRLAITRATTARRTGNWGPWETLKFPAGTVPGKGWPSQVDTAHRNACFSVLRRTDVAAGVIHLAVTNLDGARPSWWEMQRIKNELISPEATAVEVYPPQQHVVDGADMFHIWIVKSLNFGLHLSFDAPDA